MSRDRDDLLRPAGFILQFQAQAPAARSAPRCPQRQHDRVFTMIKPASALLLAAAAAVLPVRADASRPAALLQDWAAANGACRGGSGDDPKTWDACARRDALDARLAAAGWCYGRPDEPGYRRAWHPCGEVRR